MLRLFLVTTLNCTLLTLNFRAIAKGRMLWAVVTDGLIFGLGFYTIKWVTEAKDEGVVAYALGGMVGSVVGMLLSRHWREQ